jgi:glycerophosphoryl diester phosphodiesterase
MDLKEECQLSKTLNLAHRGANTYAPENTMAAFRKAVEVGATGLEFDVQLSKDGAVVVIHDEKLERTTNGSGLVKDYTLDELQRLDAGTWFGEAHAGEKIPTLEQVLDEFASTKLIYNIELKSGIVLYPGLEEKVIEAVKRRSLNDQVVLSSFNHYSLVTCRDLDKEIRTGMLYVAGLFEPWDYALKLGCYSVHPLFYHLQHPELVSGFRDHNLAIYAWTVNEPVYMEMMVAGGIDAIITDRPRDLQKIIDGGK